MDITTLALHRAGRGSSTPEVAKMNGTKSTTTHDQSALRRRLASRKLSLLASVAALAGGVLLAGPGGYLTHAGTTPLITAAQAAEQGSQSGPRGFGDIVQKV